MELTVITYNIRRLGAETDKLNLWHSRKKYLLDLILKHNPDIICFQEDHPEQVDYIASNLKNYSSFGFYNEDITKDIHGEANTIFYKKEKFKLVQEKFYWLSQSPEKRSKLEGQSKYHRTLNHIKLRYEKKILDLFNSHFDHLSSRVQKKEAIILNKIVSKNVSEDYIICGDFNGDMRSDQVTVLSKSFNLINKNNGSQKSVLDWSNTHPQRNCIDFVFSNLKPISTELDTYSYTDREGKQRRPSDHLPVICKLEMIDF